MREKFNAIKFIKDLVKIGTRQLENETRAAVLIISVLRKRLIPFYVQNFEIKLPKNKKAVLKADGQKIICDSSSFIGGEIFSKNRIISSLLPSKFFQDEININFNPRCEKISICNYYFAPSIAVSRDNLVKIIFAKNVRGKVEVSTVNHKSSNILVGNRKNPGGICFAHYDSIKKGAIDNASGVATLLEVIINNPEYLKKNLFVFSGCEELSYDKPVYWGYGFRFFERKFGDLLEKSKNVIVVDCVGNGSAEILDCIEVIRLAFPIKNLEKWKNKIKTIAGDIDSFMDVYHSDLDDGRHIKDKYIKSAVNLLKNEIHP